MSETVALVPFRVPSFDAIKPIDLKKIPVCDGEMHRLEQDNQRIALQLSKSAERRSHAIAKRIFFLGGSTVEMLVLLGALCGMYPAGGALLLGVVSFVLIAIVSLCASTPGTPPETEENRLLVARQRSQNERLGALLRIERLTGKYARIEADHREARNFNHDLANLVVDDCNDQDLAMIVQRRADIVQRIAGHSDPTGVPNGQLALAPASTDDRT